MGSYCPGHRHLPALISVLVQNSTPMKIYVNLVLIYKILYINVMLSFNHSKCNFISFGSFRFLLNCLTKTWTAIDSFSIIWKSDLTDKMKRTFFQAAVVSILLYGCTTWTLTKRLKKKPDGNYTRMLRALEQVLATTPHKTPTIRPLASHHENYTS